jgi:hypothetical protein
MPSARLDRLDLNEFRTSTDDVFVLDSYPFRENGDRGFVPRVILGS